MSRSVLCARVCSSSLPDRLSSHVSQVGFYERFHRDTVDFAVRHAKGRVVSVLEGGYGDRALASGAMASVVGLSALPSDFKSGQAEEWWSVPNLVKVNRTLNSCGMPCVSR
jgi:acetoin utilization deacetylase AcuC-like enzyme